MGMQVGFNYVLDRGYKTTLGVPLSYEQGAPGLVFFGSPLEHFMLLFLPASSGNTFCESFRYILVKAYSMFLNQVADWASFTFAANFVALLQILALLTFVTHGT